MTANIRITLALGTTVGGLLGYFFFIPHPIITAICAVSVGVLTGAVVGRVRADV